MRSVTRTPDRTLSGRDTGGVTERRVTDIGTRATVAVAVALHPVGTGIPNVATGGLGGGFARLTPAGIRRAAGVTGVLMLASAASVRRGYRAGWATSLVLLPVTAVQGLVQSALGDDRDAATGGER